MLLPLLLDVLHDGYYYIRPMDTVSKAKRRLMMQNVHSKDTAIEMEIRRLVYGMGYRYRLHDKRLPGKPDLVFRSRKKVIFVHGCFWHRHSCRRGRSIPKTNREFWENKFEKNKMRDKQNMKRLKKGGWSILVVWECDLLLGQNEKLKCKLYNFLEQ